MMAIALMMTTVISYVPVWASEEYDAYSADELIEAENNTQLEYVEEGNVDEVVSDESVVDEDETIEDGLTVPTNLFFATDRESLVAALSQIRSSGMPGTIEILNDFELEGDSIRINEGVDVTITSSGNNVFTLLQTTANQRHFHVGRWFDDYGILRLQNITLSGNQQNIDVNHGGVSVQGILYLEDGATIANNRASGGGGIHSSVFGSVVLNGGEISNNIATSSGGGIFLQATSASLIMNDGSRISHNTANTGGGVTMYGEFTMNGGEISNNTATQSAGGVHNFYIFVFNDGLISGNVVTNGSGGGVHNGLMFWPDGELSLAGVFTMNNGLIYDNEVAGNGGGVINFSTFVMNNGRIDYNRANNGGGIQHSATNYYSDSTVLNGGEIINNRAVNNGGGLSSTTLDCLFDLTINTAVTFSNNVAGAGLRINDELNLLHNINANGRINPGSWSNQTDVEHAFNNHDIFTPTEASEVHTVTFNLHGGSGNFPVQNVEDGQLATAPTAIPTRAGYTFVGWYTAATGGTAFDFTTPITENTVVHARWETQGDSGDIGTGGDTGTGDDTGAGDDSGTGDDIGGGNDNNTDDDTETGGDSGTGNNVGPGNDTENNNQNNNQTEQPGTDNRPMLPQTGTTAINLAKAGLVLTVIGVAVAAKKKGINFQQ